MIRSDRDDIVSTQAQELLIARLYCLEFCACYANGEAGLFAGRDGLVQGCKASHKRQSQGTKEIPQIVVQPTSIFKRNRLLGGYPLVFVLYYIMRNPVGLKLRLILTSDETKTSEGLIHFYLMTSHENQEFQT